MTDSRERVEIRDEGHLRVDHDLLPARELHDDVGPEDAALLVGRGLLLHEVAVIHHPRHLDDAAQLDLAPATPHVRCAQRGHEVARLRTQALLVGAQLLHALLEAAVRLLPDPLDALELVVHAVERVLERPDVARETGVGELEEPRAVGLERLGRDPRDGRRDALVEGPLAGGRLGLDPRQLVFERDHLIRAAPAFDQGGAHGQKDA